MKKVLFLLSSLFLLNSCAESIALLSTGASNGKIVQSSLNSAISYGVKKQTGMTPSQHAIAYVQKHNPENKKEKCLEFIDLTNSEACAAVKENISQTKKKIVKVKNSILDKSKIEDLAKKAGLTRR